MSRRVIPLFLLLGFLYPVTFASNYFDGADDGLDCSVKAAVGTNATTVAAWVKHEFKDTLPIATMGVVHGYATGAGTQTFRMRVINNPDGSGATLSCIFVSSNIIHFEAIATCGGVECLPAEDYRHVTCRYSNPLITAFIDGVSKGTASIPLSLVNESVEVAVGYDSVSNADYLIGEISDIVIFNRSLSNSQVESLALSRMRAYSSPTSWGSFTFLTFYLPMDELLDGANGGTSTRLDRSGFGSLCTGATSTTGGTGKGDILRYQ